MATDPPKAHSIDRAPLSGPVADHVTLTYEARFLRRKKLTSDHGQSFFVDLPETTHLNAGDAFVLTDGTRVSILAAAEPLLAVTGQDLTRLAWHIGNRHTPCQIEADRLLIQVDHVLADMVAKLGGTATPVTEPFTPEGGAYGHGRTMGHSHGPHDHDPDHGHDHDHHHHDHSHA